MYESEDFEAVGVEEKFGLESSSDQDIRKSCCYGIELHYQASGPNNSYVFVDRADGLDDGLVDNKDAVAVDVSVPLETMAPAEFLEVELDAINEEINLSLKEGKDETVEGRGWSSPAVNDIPLEKDISHVDGEGLQYALEEVKLEFENGNLDPVNDELRKPLKEGEHGYADRTHTDPAKSNVINLEQESFLEDADVIQDKAEEHIMKSKSRALDEIKHVEDRTNKIGSLEVVEIKKVNDKNLKIEIAVETENRKDEDQTVSKSSPGLEENQESNIPKLGLVEESGEGGKLINVPHLNECIETHNTCYAEVSLGSTEAPQLIVEDALESKLRGVSENEIQSITEVVEALESKVLLTTSINFDLELRLIKSEKETVEDTELALSTDTDNQNLDSFPKNRIQYVLDRDKRAVNNTGCYIGTVFDQFIEGKSNFFSLSCVENNLYCANISNQHPYCNRVSHEILNSETETETEVPVPSQTFSDAAAEVHEPLTQVKNCGSGAEVHEPLTDVKDCGFETVGLVSSSSMDGPKSQIIVKGPFDQVNLKRPAENSASLGHHSTGEMVIEKKLTFQGDDARFQTEVSVAHSEDSPCPHASTDVISEPEFHKNNDMISVEVLDSLATDKEGASNITLESADVKVVGNQLCSFRECSDETLLLQRNDKFGNPYEDHISKSSSEIEEDVGDDAVTKTFSFLIKTPMFNDENLREQIRDAKLDVDEKTKLRDAIRAQIQEKRANCQIHGIDYEYAKGEDRSVRRLIKLKRMEIDSLQSVVNKAKNAITIEEMDNRIDSMEHMIQHETLPLREEKQLVREIRQLKQLREQLSSNMGSQNETQQALEQRDEAEERLKILKKELVNLKDRFSKAQTAAWEAESKYDDQNKKVKELKDHFRAADDVRQAAYSKWLSLRKQFWQKNKYFAKYKEDEAAANNYAFIRNREALCHLCMDQVENFMELWNGDTEFRREYVSFNTRSTVWRFGTLDGRSLGQDEKPHVLPNYVTKERNEKIASVPENINQSPALEPKQQRTVGKMISDIQLLKKVPERENQTVTSKGPPKSEKGNRFDTVSGWHASDEMPEEDCLKMREERELIRKEEEIRREEAETKKKEELRLEQLTKAKEAREKKRRHDERVQMREESRARREAELKEKERVKRMRKKERKITATANESSESSESTVEICKDDDQISDISSSATCKKPKNNSMASRQNKTKSIPPHIRNRNRKKWQQWMWVILACLVIILVFWLGNMGLFANVNLKRRGPVF